MQSAQHRAVTQCKHTSTLTVTIWILNLKSQMSKAFILSSLSCQPSENASLKSKMSPSANINKSTQSPSANTAAGQSWAECEALVRFAIEELV